MNKFKKYYTNVFVAECEEAKTKGDIIVLETKYSKEVECEVFNLVSTANNKYYYSIVRLEDMNYAEKKATKYIKSANVADNNSHKAWEASKEGAEFLVLAEPIKVGHHSEKRHRALIERNNKRMSKCVSESDRADTLRQKSEYWENKAKEITLSMPESLEYFTFELDKAKEYHKGLKDGTIKKEHSYSVTYANKKVKELTKKVEIANILWGV